jgi:(2Fe-2S) ferredoxin
MLPGTAPAGGEEQSMQENPQPYEILILVCTNLREDGREACGSRGSAALRDALKGVVGARGLKGRVRVSQTGCLGQCALGPNIMIFPDGVWYSGVTEDDLPDLIARHLGG